jgi:hypothetical protein
VVGARDEWTPNFGGIQYTLGLAWYTHLEEGRSDAYRRGAARSNALVERVLPGFAQQMLQALKLTLGAAVHLRPGWCGPGVHVFPAGAWVSQHGGDRHSDTEGLSEAQLTARAPAITAVLCLRRPEHGGGLRLWSERDGDPVTHGPPLVVSLAPGDLICFDSYRVHQIEPFDGAIDRITATVHAVKTDEGWQAWF